MFDKLLPNSLEAIVFWLKFNWVLKAEFIYTHQNEVLVQHVKAWNCWLGLFTVNFGESLDYYYEWLCFKKGQFIWEKNETSE